MRIQIARYNTISLLYSVRWAEFSAWPRTFRHQTYQGKWSRWVKRTTGWFRIITANWIRTNDSPANLRLNTTRWSVLLLQWLFACFVIPAETIPLDSMWNEHTVFQPRAVRLYSRSAAIGMSFSRIQGGPRSWLTLSRPLSSGDERM